MDTTFKLYVEAFFRVWDRKLFLHLFTQNSEAESEL